MPSTAVLLRFKLASLAVLAAATAVTRFAQAEHLVPEVGWDYGDIETPRIAALGGAVRAFSNSVDALFINPAGMASTPVYHIGGLVEVWPEANRQSYAAGIVDSILSSTKLAGGLAGAWTRQNPHGLGPDALGREAADFRFALAFPFSDKFMVGAGARYLKLRQDGDGPLGPSFASGGLHRKAIIDGFGFDLGATVKLSQSFGLALVGTNINAPDNGLQPATLGGGVGYGTENFTVEGDLVADFTTWQTTTVRAMTGFEYLAGDHYPLRIGYRFDQGAESHALSAGLGYVDPTFSLDAALRRVIVGSAATAIFVAFTYHLEATGLASSGADSF
jgi:hypothetical protein